MQKKRAHRSIFSWCLVFKWWSSFLERTPERAYAVTRYEFKRVLFVEHTKDLKSLTVKALKPFSPALSLRTAIKLFDLSLRLWA